MPNNQVNCSRCGYLFDAAKAVDDDDATPTAGAVSICFRCGNLAMFTGDGLKLRVPTPDEQAEIIANSEIQRIFRGLVGYWLSQTKGDRFPCGCVIGSKEKMLFFQPCSLTCSVYAYFIEEARKQGKPIDTIVIDESRGI